VYASARGVTTLFDILDEVDTLEIRLPYDYFVENVIDPDDSSKLKGSSLIQYPDHWRVYGPLDVDEIRSSAAGGVFLEEVTAPGFRSLKEREIPDGGVRRLDIAGLDEGEVARGAFVLMVDEASETGNGVPVDIAFRTGAGGFCIDREFRDGDRVACRMSSGAEPRGRSGEAGKLNVFVSEDAASLWLVNRTGGAKSYGVGIDFLSDGHAVWAE